MKMDYTKGENKMMQTVEVKSNIGGRLKKIREGVVFNSVTSVIGELGQNAQRALNAAVAAGKNPDEASIFLEFSPDKKTFMVSDNGIGCSNPQDILELDVSGFGVGFGEGFSSVFLIADRIIINSNDWYMDIDVIKMMENADYEVQVHKSDVVKDGGFTVILSGQKIEEHHDELLRFTEEMASLLPYPTLLNGAYVKKKDLSDLGRRVPYKMDVDNEFFSGTLGANNSWDDVQVYYENRYVCAIWKSGLCGNIMLKPGAVNLKAPDRREIIYDAKRTALMEKLQECGKVLYQGFLEHDSDKALTEYAEKVEAFLSVDEYIPFLEMDVAGLDFAKMMEEKHKPHTDEQLLEAAGLDTPHQEHFGGSSRTVGGSKLKIDGGDAAEIGTAEPRFEKSRKESEKLTKAKTKKRQKNYGKFIEKLNKMKAQFKVVWATLNEIDTYEPQLKELKGYGFTVLTAKSKLYESAFRHLDILHFQEVESNVQIKYSFNNIGAADGKESRVLWLLERIEEILKTPNLFRICDIECQVEHFRNNQLVATETRVCRYRYDKASDRIYIDRKHLELPSYRVEKWNDGKINLNDLRLMLKNLEFIAQEVTKFKKKSHEVAEGFWESKDAVLRELAELF
jgi:hypothetical protein